MHNFTKYPPAIFVHNAEPSKKILEMLQLQLYKTSPLCYTSECQERAIPHSAYPDLTKATARPVPIWA